MRSAKKDNKREIYNVISHNSYETRRIYSSVCAQMSKNFHRKLFSIIDNWHTHIKKNISVKYFVQSSCFLQAQVAISMVLILNSARILCRVI